MSTSRVGRKPVSIPSGVEVLVQGSDLTIKGPKGQLTMPLHPSVKIDLDDKKELKVVPSNAGYSRRGSGSKLKKSIVGTIRAKIFNMIHGVSQGFERKLVLVGVGYRAQTKDSALNLSIGFSHPVVIAAPKGIVFETPSLTEIIVKGIDKHLVGHIASKIRAVRPPEPYAFQELNHSLQHSAYEFCTALLNDYMHVIVHKVDNVYVDEYDLNHGVKIAIPSRL